MDYKMSKFDIDRIACLMYRDIAAYIDDQRKQSSDCDAAARKEEKQDTVKAGLHNAVVSPRKRHALLALLLLGAALCAAIYWPYHLPASLVGVMLVPAAFVAAQTLHCLPSSSGTDAQPSRFRTMHRGASLWKTARCFRRIILATIQFQSGNIKGRRF